MKRRVFFCAAAVLGSLSAGAAQLHLASPGTSSGEQTTPSSCPSFSWTPAAEAVELVVLEVGAGGAPSDAVVLRETLPGGITSWTPPVERCLAPGRYAWTVRTATGDQAIPHFFRVASDPLLRIRELETTVRALEERLRSPAGTVQPAVGTSAEVEPSAGQSEPLHQEAGSPDPRWLAGASYSPPACSAPDIFSDAGSSNLLCPWIEQAYNDGWTQGCGGGKYCPTNPVSRQQLAVFLGKVQHADAGGDLTGNYPGPSIKPAFRLPQACSNGQYASWNGSTWQCSTPSGAGDITAVNAGNAMTGGGANGDVTIGAAVPFHIQANGGHWGEIAGPGIGGTGDTGVVGWGNTGVFGYGGGTGVWGETGVSSGVGVRGNAWAGGIGVVGYSGGGNHGVYGESISGRGVAGYASSTSGSTYGLWGQAASSLGVGVYGRGSTATGFTNGFVGPTGVWGDTSSGTGVFGTALGGVGVVGYSNSGTGVRAEGTVDALAALEVRNGALRISGPAPAAFKVSALVLGQDMRCNSGEWLPIDSPYANGHAEAIVVTSGEGLLRYRIFYSAGALYDCPAGRWIISSPDMTTSAVFHVLVLWP